MTLKCDEMCGAFGGPCPIAFFLLAMNSFHLLPLENNK
jgi:hypothetical protein